MRLIHNLRRMGIFKGRNNNRMIKGKAIKRMSNKMTLLRSLRKKNQQHRQKSHNKKRKLIPTTTIISNLNNF